MSSITMKIRVLFTPQQIQKMKRHHKKQEEVSVRLSGAQLFVDNGTEVQVDELQYKRMKSAAKAGRGYILKLSPDQIGGFLPLLVAGASALAPALLSGVASAGSAFATKKLLDTVFPDKKKGEGLTLPGTMRGRGLRLAGAGQKKTRKKKDITKVKDSTMN